MLSTIQNVKTDTNTVMEQRFIFVSGGLVKFIKSKKFSFPIVCQVYVLDFQLPVKAIVVYYNVFQQIYSANNNK